MPRANLRRLAAEQARAEFQPQIRGVRRETGAQVHSLNTMAPALTASLEHSAEQLRHAGLSPRDLAIAETELAHRTADVGAGVALQGQQVRQEGHGQVLDLLASQGQAQRAGLTTLLSEAAQRQQDLRDEQRSSAQDFKMDILKEETLKKLGLGSYADDGANGGLTPTQERDTAQSKHTAAFHAHQLISASKEGVKDPKTGELLVPAGPSSWDDSIWDQFTEQVASEKGVNSVTDAEHAVQAIRDHFQGGGGGQAGPMDALRKVAAVAAPALAPDSLQPIAQFAGKLLGR